MTSLFAKLPLEFQVELEPIRRRLAAPFSRISAQKIFDDHADTIDKLLALGLSHVQLATILFELGLTGKDGKRPKTNSISRSLNRSRQHIEPLKHFSREEAGPGAFLGNGASQINDREAKGVETAGARSRARLDGRVADVSSSTVARPAMEIGPFIGDDRRNAVSCPFDFCPLYRRRGFAAEQGETFSQGAEHFGQGPCGQIPTAADKARQTTAALDETSHGAFRQGTAALDKARPNPAAADGNDRHGPCHAIQTAAAHDSLGCVDKLDSQIA
jgi:hypothetical protein